MGDEASKIKKYVFINQRGFLGDSLCVNRETTDTLTEDVDEPYFDAFDIDNEDEMHGELKEL